MPLYDVYLRPKRAKKVGKLGRDVPAADYRER